MNSADTGTEELSLENWLRVAGEPGTSVWVAGDNKAKKRIREAADRLTSLQQEVKQLREVKHFGRHSPGDYPYTCLACKIFAILTHCIRTDRSKEFRASVNGYLIFLVILAAIVVLYES